MSLTYGFYNSLNHDRLYDATQMSSLFDGIIRDGIFESIGTQMMVKERSGMTVSVGEGRAWFNHTWTLLDAEYVVEVPEAEVVLDRIDALVLEVDSSIETRANSIKIIKGTPSSEPVPPVLAETETLHQHRLANISVKAGTTTITQAEITNFIGTSETPFITGILETMNVDSLIAQWQSEYKQMKDADHTNYISTLNSDHAQYEAQREADDRAFDTWFANKMQEVLDWYDNLKIEIDHNVAVNLQNQIGTLNLLTTETKTNLVAAINELVAETYPCFIRATCAEEFASDTVELIYDGKVIKSKMIPSSEPYMVEFGVKETGKYTLREVGMDITANVNVGNYTIYNVGLYLGAISLTVDEGFMGYEISCSDGTTTKKWICDGLMHTFSVGLGNWTISATVEGTEYSVKVNVTEYKNYDAELHLKTTFEFQQWLDAAGITKKFDTLEDVLADEKTVRTLMTKHASVDVLVDLLANDEESANTILNNDICAKWINLRDYALDKLSSGYNLIPYPYTDGMSKTSNGITYTVNSDGSVTANGTVTGATSYFQVLSRQSQKYKFPKGKLRITGCPEGGTTSTYFMELGRTKTDGSYGSLAFDYGDGKIFDVTEDAYSQILIGIKVGTTVNNLTFKPMLVKVDENGTYPTEFYKHGASAITKIMDEVDKYGYGEWVIELKGIVPIMTSDIAENGQAIAQSSYSDRSAYFAFSPNETEWSSNLTISSNTPTWIGFRFNHPTKIKRVHYRFGTTVTSSTSQIVARNNNGEWVALTDLRTDTTLDNYIDIETNENYTDYALRITKQTVLSGSYLGRVDLLQFYDGSITGHAKGNVPVMTSNTAPYGVASAYQVFDGNASTSASGTDFSYQFVNPISIKKFESDIADGTLQVSDDGITWITNDNGYHLYARVHYSSSKTVHTIQFYGRELKISVPKMTSNTEPWGEVSADSSYDIGGLSSWKAFDGVLGRIDGYSWMSNKTSNQEDHYIIYDFNYSVCIRSIMYNWFALNNYAKNHYIKLYGSNDKTNWSGVIYSKTIDAITTTGDAQTLYFDFENSNGYRYYKLVVQANRYDGGSYYVFLPELQFYGLDYSEHDERHYIYDHGVELEEISSHKDSAGIIEKRSDELYASSPSNIDAWFITRQIDLSDYDLLRMVVGKQYIKGSDTLAVSRSNTQVDRNTMVASVSPIDNLPNNVFLNISNVKDSLYCVMDAVNSTVTIAEWWLE